MTEAEKKALELYPIPWDVGMEDTEPQRKAFLKGYSQAFDKVWQEWSSSNDTLSFDAWLHETMVNSKT